MAVDTASKRASAFNYNSFLLILPIPDGSIDGGDQQHLLDCYSGINFDTPVVPPIIRTIPTSPRYGPIGGSDAGKLLRGSSGIR